MVRLNYRNVEILTDLDVLKYIKERNQILVRFLCGSSGVYYEKASSKTKYAFGTYGESGFSDSHQFVPFTYLIHAKCFCNFYKYSCEVFVSEKKQAIQTCTLLTLARR